MVKKAQALRDLPIKLIVCSRLDYFVRQMDFWYDEGKEIKRIRQGEFLVNNIRHIFISAGNPQQMQGFRGVKVEIWGSIRGISQENLDLIQQYKISVERP